MLTGACLIPLLVSSYYSLTAIFHEAPFSHQASGRFVFLSINIPPPTVLSRSYPIAVYSPFRLMNYSHVLDYQTYFFCLPSLLDTVARLFTTYTTDAYVQNVHSTMCGGRPLFICCYFLVS